MSIEELYSEKRVALSFYKVEGLEWSKDYNKIMKLLEKETNKNYNKNEINNGIREFKAKIYEEKYKELHMSAVVDIAEPIKERVIENGLMVIKDGVHYEPRDIYSVYRYESSLLIVYARDMRDAGRFIY